MFSVSMYFVIAKLNKDALPTHAWLVYMYWQQLYGKKPGQVSQELGEV